MSKTKTASERLSVFVVSDLHAFDSNARKYSPDQLPSFLDISQPETLTQSPLFSLQQYISAHTVKADVLVCCGDIGDKAYPSAISHTWERINKLKSALDAKLLVSTVGNHDVDSRYKYNDYDAKGYIQGLSPTFPGPNEARTNEFWAQHFGLQHFPRLSVWRVSAGHYGEPINRVPSGAISYIGARFGAGIARASA